MPRSNAHRACNDFHATSEATRRAYLPGEGALTRRQLVGRGVAAGLTIYAAKAMNVARVFEAAEAAYAQAPTAPVLVSVFLPGGCDLLDTLVPLDQFGTYADLRPQIKQTQAPKLGSTGLGLHPSMASGLNGGVKGLFEAGKVGFMPGIDYANYDLSHFHSRHFWETGLITPKSATGWLGRLLDQTGNHDNPLQGVSMTGALAPVLRSASAPVAAVSSPDSAQFWIPGVYGQAMDYAMGAWEEISSRAAATPGAAAATQTSRQAKQVADTLAPYKSTKNGDPLAGSVQYPADSDFADRLKSLAGLLAQPLGIRVAAVEAEGDFDTHDRQTEDLGTSLKMVSEGLSAFQADLESRGIADRVLTLVWSEFGRRPNQNESNGSDHGAGGLAYVIGTKARGGILSDYPDLKRLDRQDNLAVTLDFRRLYSSVLEQWMGTDAASVIPNAGSFGRLQVTA
ncbi:MAG: hypothetical protein QOF37_1353 [Thermoleophilaceae bacterium]|nr:hypothetical protein [Thermoleophilaceae bacterium]